MENYKFAAMSGVKSMQKYWLLRELEEAENAPRGRDRNLEIMDVLALMFVYKIDLEFLEPSALKPAYDRGMTAIKLNWVQWADKRRGKGHTSPDIQMIDLMEKQLILNEYVERR